jgi:hypothetical protein
MNAELYISEDRYISWWQFEVLSQTSRMRVKTGTKVNDKGKKVPYVVALDFINVGGNDKFYDYDFYKMKCTEKLEKIVLQFLDTNHPQMKYEGQTRNYKYFHLANISIFNETYIMGHSFSDGDIEFFSIFFKEDMKKNDLGYSIKVPMTSKEIKVISNT